MALRINSRDISAQHDGDESYTFPTLYKIDKMNRPTYHKLRVEGNRVLAFKGIVGMKETSYPPLEAKSKNVGKKNETTPHQQALLEAQSKWDSKIQKQGFTLENTSSENAVTPSEKTVTSSENAVTNSGKKIFPMLANKFTSKFSKYPCQVSPKLDGCRCVSSLENGNVKLYSRATKEFNFLEKLREHLLYILDDVNLPMVDGELYSHTLPFTLITSIIRQKKNKSEYDHLLEYWIFDIPDKSGSMTYNDRVSALKIAENKYNKKVKNNSERVLKFVYSTTANSIDDVKKLHDEYVSDGYEGAMIRLPDSKYEFYRSKSLLKYKEFTDDEFKVVDAIEGKGLDKGAVVFICEAKNGERFNVRPRGSVEKRKWQFQNRNMYIGKMLTVRFQNTGTGIDKDAPPRFGVGIDFSKNNGDIVEAVDFRDYE